MKKIIIYALFFGIVLFVLAISYGIYMYPKIKKLKDPKYSFEITVYDWNKNPHPFIVGPKNPRYVSWKNISPYIKWAVILSEDAKFYKHSGVDYDAIKEAFKKNLEMGKYVRGGSTITQQLAKNLFLSREKTIIRKLKELIIAYLLETTLTKTRILELYLNVVEFGPMVYGVNHACWFYFGKSPIEVSPMESAILAGLLPGPKIYNPYRNLEKVEARAKRILTNMYNAKIIDTYMYDRLLNANLVINLEKKVELKKTFNNHTSLIHSNWSSLT
ncbi:MAG: monofunctional biosynthetic peptidoglycan transglycosylase, partial [Proteobacteria bacterium]|nr:monofunctional biosynthetic peptidoglycan transglycosylase [Pseudomonadota bacterium]